MIQLPVLQQSILDAATDDSLFADLATCAQVLSIVPKTADQACVELRQIDLATAREGLRGERFRAVQIRYRFENREWCDTLLPQPGGAARIVRICTDDALNSAGAE